MSQSEVDRQREYPGDRFSRRILEQDLDELSQKLENEEFGEGHLEQGHNQIELYRHDNTTVSLFLMEEGANLPEHSVDDGSVMIQVLEGEIQLETGDKKNSLSTKKNSAVTLGSGVAHTIRAEKFSRFLVTIMR